MRGAVPGREVEFGILGPMRAAVDGRPVPVPAGKHRMLLGALLLRANQLVPVSELVDHLWAESPPADGRAAVHTYVYRLRRTFDLPEMIVTHGEGYLINIPPVVLDLHRFRELLDLADKAALCADPSSESAHLRDALALWRGPALADVPSETLRGYALALDEERLRVIERCVDMELTTGRHADLISELRGLVAEHPLRERFWQQLMLALHRSGRQAEALEAYRTIDRRLRHELGIGAGADLRHLHQAMLTGEVSGASAPATSPPAHSSTVPPVPRPLRVDSGTHADDRWVAPRQLPTDIRGFVGREAALGVLDGLVGDASGPVTAVIGGAAGIGKTTLAVHWAQRVADRFPDGHLYANLRGFDPGGMPRPPVEVLRSFLTAMRVPPQEIPADLETQSGLYRSLLVGKRMLVVLDNARDAEQVRPLLPGSSGNLVVVTSRDRLTSLIAVEGAYPIVLAVLSVADSRRLLTHRIGANRVDSDPVATTEVIGFCAALPLALSIVAARAALQPDFSLSALAAQLRTTQTDLSGFHSPDPAADLRAVFSWSFQPLGDATVRLFQLLALHPGPDLGEHAAASLAGRPVAEVRRLLAELASANLIAEPEPGRYSLHDLLRTYAIEQSALDETQRRDAMRRMLDYYVHSGHAAAMLLNPEREPITLSPAQPGVVPERFVDHRQALRWCDVEQAVLLAMVPYAATIGFDVHAWQLAWVFNDALDRRGFWHEIVDTQLIAIEAAARLADRRAGAQCRRNVARGYGLLSRFDEADEVLREALDLYGDQGHQFGRALTHRSISWILGRQDRLTEAIDHARQAMLLFHEAGDLPGQGRALNSIAWMHCRLGMYQAAVEHCEQSLRLQQETGNSHGLAATWDTLGFAKLNLGRHAEAMTYLRHAVDLLGDIGARYGQANALTHLADAHIAAGDTTTGREVLQRAFDILLEFGHADADRVREKLKAL